MADKSSNGRKRYLPDELIRSWDERIRLRFREMAPLRDVWTSDYDLVRNAESRQLRGNLAADFVRILTGRFFVKDMNVTVSSDDPDGAVEANKISMVAQSLQRIGGLQSALREATMASTWATYGWYEVGHPMDPCNLDPVRSFAAPRSTPSATYDDEWVPVPGTLADMITKEVGEVPEFDPTERTKINYESSITPIIGNTDYGHSYAQPIDPRYMIFPIKNTGAQLMDWVARVRFLTPQELYALTGLRFEKKAAAYSEMVDLFCLVEGQERIDYPDLICVIDMWIARDRNNPQFNNWHLCWVHGCPEYVIFDEPNPYKALTPIFRITPNPIKKATDPSIAAELAPYAEHYDLAMQKVELDLKEMLNEKWLAEDGAGMSDDDKKRYLNPNFKGVVKGHAGGLQKKEVKFDRNILSMLTFYRSSAQQSTSTSDLDQGIAIKGITAAQTEALLTATGINVEDIRNQVESAGRQGLMAMMHLMGIFGVKNKVMRFAVDARTFVSLDIGTLNFTSSYLYDIRLQDSGPQSSNEELILWNQLLKLFNTPVGQQMVMKLDMEKLVRDTLSAYGRPMSLMLQGEQPSGIPQVEGGELPPTGQAASMGLGSMVDGQHPEREIGSRGLNDSGGNALRGALKTGT